MVAAGNGRGHGRLDRSRRLTRGIEIRATMVRGKRSRTAHLDVYDSASPVARPRAGIVVPKYGGTAVERNRLKRRLRAVLRTEVLPRLDGLGTGRDVVVRARRAAREASYEALRNELIEWFERRWPAGSSWS